MALVSVVILTLLAVGVLARSLANIAGSQVAFETVMALGAADALAEVDRLENRPALDRWQALYASAAVDIDDPEFGRDLVAAARALTRLSSAMDQTDAAVLRAAQSAAKDALINLVSRVETAEESILRDKARRIDALANIVYGFLALTALGCGVVLRVLRGEVLARQRSEDAERRIERLAYADGLTGIANRTRFFDGLASTLATRKQGTVLLVDLDNFRELNERNSRALGDAVLKEIAHHLSKAADRVHGFAARLGSDDFGLYVPFEDDMRLTELMESLVRECATPVSKGGDTVEPEVSIGAAPRGRVLETMPVSHESMIRVADFALNAARAPGQPGMIAVYDKVMESTFVDRKSMVEELPAAISTSALEVFLQPKVSLRDASVCGFEALVRWTRSGHPVPPADLIRVAEESGLIVDLDRYMLDCAVGLVADWNRRRGTAFALSVNISARHMTHGDIADEVVSCLEKHRFPPELLTIELTETIELGNWNKAQGALTRLKAAGCRISIDDFGIGYSSLAYLRAIDADELKIDKSLTDSVEVPETRLILQTVRDLADKLGLSVVVEGVEHEDQAQALSALGFTFGQGYFFGRPRPAADWLADVTYGVSADRIDGTDTPQRALASLVQ